MNKKFYLLALICAVAGTSVISSCKDTDEDLYVDLKNQLAQSDKNYQDLKKAIDELKSGILNGKDGKDGASAYEIWLKEGNTGTEADFLESLKGKDGNDGKDASIDDLLEALKAYETKEEHQADVDYILSLIEKLKKDIASLDVAGIIIQNVYNPAFGYIATPLGIQTNILAGYYSTVAKTEKFPYFKDLGDLPASKIDAKEYDLTDLPATVGKVYLSVNPSNADFEGKVPSIVNTKGQVDGIALSALKACDEELYFGATRAASNLYVAEATVGDRGYTEEIHLNLKENAKTLKEALKGEGIDAIKVIKVMYEMLNKVCQRKAVQISNEKSTVVSEFGLAAAIVNPMSFSTVESVSGSSYMDKIKNVINDYKGKDSSVDRVLSKAITALDDLSAACQPTIIAQDAEGSYLLSADASAPTTVPSELKLHAVSFCGEILVPFAAKYVVATKAPTPDALAAINNTIHMNQALLGEDCCGLVINLAGLEPGDYTIQYAAMDYAGASRAQTFYFTVK